VKLSGQGRQLVGSWNTLQARRLADGLEAVAISEMFGAALLAANGVSRRKIERLDAESERLNKQLLSAKRTVEIPTMLDAFERIEDNALPTIGGAGPQWMSAYLRSGALRRGTSAASTSIPSPRTPMPIPRQLTRSLNERARGVARAARRHGDNSVDARPQLFPAPVDVREIDNICLRASFALSGHRFVECARRTHSLLVSQEDPSQQVPGPCPTRRSPFRRRAGHPRLRPRKNTQTDHRSTGCSGNRCPACLSTRRRGRTRPDVDFNTPARLPGSFPPFA
jgi:hypothetical protein